MIVGNSHWSDDHELDREEATIDVIENVMNRHYNIAFFNQIRDYFGVALHSDFWPQVVFMNYAPRSIGSGDNRFAQLTWELAAEAKTRFVREISSHQPQLVFVFSKKIQWALPTMEFAPVPAPLKGARVGVLPEATGTKIYLLRHTQGARKQEMIDTVSYALAAG
jgi:hypothetical protein